MSMICSVTGLSSAQVEALRATPSLATGVAMASLGGDGDLSQLGALQPELDLQKSWHILHYLFIGSVDDTSSPGGTLLAGEELGEDVGYGPARLLDESMTAEFARFLQGLDADSLLARMNIGEMASAGVYAVSDDDEDLREEVAYFFPQLRDYVVQVAQKQGGLLTWLS